MHLSEINFKLYAFVHNYSSVELQEGGLTVASLGTPLLADPVYKYDKYAKMSRRKHPNQLRHVCEISTETAKHGRNCQPQNSLN